MGLEKFLFIRRIAFAQVLGTVESARGGWTAVRGSCQSAQIKISRNRENFLKVLFVAPLGWTLSPRKLVCLTYPIDVVLHGESIFEG